MIEKSRLAAVMASISFVVGGCDFDHPSPRATPSATTPTPSLTWAEPPVLKTSPGCAAFAETARETARTWMRLEIERARRHIQEVGVAIAPSSTSARTTTPSWLRDGSSTTQRDRVLVSDGLLAVVADHAVNFVTAEPDETMRQIAQVPVTGTPWAVAQVGPHGHIVVVSRHEDPEGASTTLTRLDPAGLLATEGSVTIVESHTVPGTLGLVAQHGNNLRLVTQGHLQLSSIATWPEGLEPTATPAEQEAAFSELESRNLDIIDAMKLSDLVPDDLVERCSDGMFPGTYLGAGWLLISDFATTHGGGEEPARRLPVIGEYAAMTANADSVVLVGTNWPYMWLLDEDDASQVQTEIHRVTAEGTAFAQRIEGAPAGSNAIAMTGEHVIVTTASAPSFVSRNFAPRGLARVTSLSRDLRVIDVIEDALDGSYVAHAVFTGTQAYLLPEAPGSSVAAVAWDLEGTLTRTGTVPSVPGQRLVAVGETRLASIEPRPDLPDTGVQVVMYDVTPGTEPFVVGPPLQVQTSIRRPEGDTTIAVDLDGVILLDDHRLLAVPLQVSTADSSGYWGYSARLNLFALDTNGPAALGQIDHEGLDHGQTKMTSCQWVASDQRFTGAAVQNGILYSVSTAGVLAHQLDMLNDTPLADTTFDHTDECDAAGDG